MAKRSKRKKSLKIDKKKKSLIGKIFSSKKVPEIGDESVDERSEEVAETNEPTRGDSSFEIESLKAKVETLMKFNEATNENFNRLSEQIGELRSSLLEKEQSIKEIIERTERTFDVVKELKPEKFLIDYKKLEQKIEMLQSKAEVRGDLLESLKKEMSEMRSKIEVFTGKEEMLSLYDDIRKEAKEIEKIKSIIEKEGEKISNLFVKVDKQYIEFKNFMDEKDSILKMFNDISDQIDNVKDIKNIVKASELKDAIRSLKKETTETIKKEQRNNKKQFQKLSKRISKLR